MTICVHFMSPLASNVNLNTTPTKVKCALPYPIYHLKGSNSHTKPGVFQLGMSFNRRGCVAQSCNQSRCLYTHLAIVQDHDPAAAHHRVETMGDDEGGAAAKCTANGLLDETICLGVDGCCCLIQNKNLEKTQQTLQKQ